MKEITYPENVKIEQGILDIFLEFSEYRDEILIQLKPQWFYWEIHKQIYENFVKILAKNNALDVRLLLGNVTDKHYSYILQNILNKIPSGAPYIGYLKELRELYYKRELITSCLKVIQSPDLSYDDLQNAVASSLKTTEISNANWQSLREIILENDTEEAYNALTQSFLKTNIKLFQQKVIVKKGDFVLLAGRPSMGKTAFCLELGKQSAKCGQKVGLVSCEMRKPYLLKRLAHSESLESGFIGYQNGCEKLFNLPFWIEDGARNNLNILDQKIQVIIKKHGLDVLLIDYLGLLEGPETESRTTEVTKISNFLKRSAQKYNIPFIVLSQLSRKLEERACKQPQLSDLRDSGAIEQDADIVLFCYRPFQYPNNTNKAELVKSYNLSEEMQKEFFALCIAKQRDGDLDNLFFRYIPERNFFTTWDLQHEEPKTYFSKTVEPDPF